jgi:hypothetical protein
MRHRFGRDAWRLASRVMPILAAAALLAPTAPRAEPYLAVRAGVKCMACHVNPTGGGKRNEFGSVYGQTALARERLDPATGRSVPAGAAAPPAWTGRINDVLGLGADFRATAQSVDVPRSPDTYAFNPTRAQFYAEVKAIGERLTLYLDQRVAPGAATNRETYALLWFADRSLYLKAGRLFIPFGLRIEDDSAFIRQVSGANFSSSDDGVEGGLEIGPWSAHVSVTNGAGGAAETNRGKQFSTLASYVQPDWRVGLSASTNFNGNADRRMQSAFAGLRFGILSALASALYVTDEGTPLGRLRQRATFVEGNLEVAQGHNVKLGYEYHDPNVDVREDHRVRYSAVWEVVPFQFTQFRLGARKGDGIPQNNAQNATEVFLQWHAFF